MNNKFHITGRGVSLSEPLRIYLERKVSKINKLFNHSFSVYCEIVHKKTRIGVNNVFAVEISISLPRAYIKVEKEGYDVYEVIDEIEPVLQRQIKKYRAKRIHKNRKQKFSQIALQF